MKRYAAFLRGVSPMNAKMADLKRAFEVAGFEDVRTVQSSGNIVFSTRAASERSLERRAEAAMDKELGRTFPAIVRSVDALRRLLEDNPFRDAPRSRGAKRVVTFLRRQPPADFKLPAKVDNARIVDIHDREAFTVYTPGPHGPVFMTLIEKAFGKEVTTRTWETIERVAR